MFPENCMFCFTLSVRSLGFFVEPFVRSRFEALFRDGATVSGSTGLATSKKTTLEPL